MKSFCPICGAPVAGEQTNRSDTSYLRSLYKLLYSFIIPIPFVGSFLGKQVYNLSSNPNIFYHKFLCESCRFCWFSNEMASSIKIGGNKDLGVIFQDDIFAIGAFSENLFLSQSIDGDNVLNSVVSNDGSINLNKYINGRSPNSSKMFQKTKIMLGHYIGETLDDEPDGWGVVFQRDGKLWYGKWKSGQKNGVGFECDFDGSNYNAGYWQSNQKLV